MTAFASDAAPPTAVPAAAAAAVAKKTKKKPVDPTDGIIEGHSHIESLDATTSDAFEAVFVVGADKATVRSDVRVVVSKAKDSRTVVVSAENTAMLARHAVFVRVDDGGERCSASAATRAVLVNPGDSVELLRFEAEPDAVTFRVPPLAAWFNKADFRVCDADQLMCLSINQITPERSVVRVLNRRVDDVTLTWSFDVSNGTFVDHEDRVSSAPYVVIVPGEHNDGPTKSSSFAPKVPTVVGSFLQTDPSKQIAFHWHYNALRCNAAAEHANVLYELPFRVADDAPSVRVSQKAGGTFSHQGKHAVDFGMDEGTDVLAMRAGVVTSVVMDNFLSKFAPGVCPKPVTLDCKTPGADANVVVVLHDDGTYAQYAHLAQKSAAVAVGDRVVAGQTLAKSGNTGFSTSPHLHVDVSIHGKADNVSVPIAFRDPSLPAVPRSDEVPDDCVVLTSRTGRTYYACGSNGNEATFERPRRPDPHAAVAPAAEPRVITSVHRSIRAELTQLPPGAIWLDKQTFNKKED